MRVYYLVSGAENIKPSHDNLKRAGRFVRHGTEVSGEADEALRANGRFIVIAHGDEGTVFWERSDWDRPRHWLYVGMANPPKNARVFVYACKVGKQLPRFLKKCVAYTFVNVVPMPVEDQKTVVIGFLAKAERLLKDDDCVEEKRWTQELAAYVDELIFDEFAKKTPHQRTVMLLFVIRSALGNPA